MATVCAVCARPADQFRDVVSVVNMRVQVICRACAGEREHVSAPATERSVPVPRLSDATGSADAREGTVRVAAGAKPQIPKASGLVVVVSLGLASVAFFAWRATHHAAGPVVAADAPAGAGARPPLPRAGIGIAGSSGEDFDVNLPPPVGLEAVLDGAWTHPLAGPYRELPHNDVQRFGAYRARDEFFKRYCGSGHCGVDIGLIVGLPVIAARDGVIDRAIYEPTELEGKYIRLAHAGGVYTYYMHLDQVAPGLRKGDAVKAGQMIGTLGHTGIKNSAAHLHFMISFESRGKELYVDPEPLLTHANLVEIEPIPSWARPSEPAR
jgi:murein DD-endopeptidase MepM/ murein hydrolase activator NlpD